MLIFILSKSSSCLIFKPSQVAISLSKFNIRFNYPPDFLKVIITTRYLI
jgi:hypothetical protein